MNTHNILVLIVILCGCSKGAATPAAPTPTATISPKFLFPDSARDKREILAKITAVKKGDKIEDVVKQVGHSYSTEPYELEDTNQKYGTRLIYNLTESHGVYEDIVFWFGNDDRLVKVTNTIAEGPRSPPGKRHTKEIDLENLKKPDNR